MRRMHFVFELLGVMVLVNMLSMAQIKVEVQGDKASLASPARVHVSQGVSTGLLIRKVPPNYPPLAKQARIQGQVVLQAEISKEGTIQNLELISGHPLLAPSAIEAVKQWRYKPYYLNGEAVEVETQIVVNFTLSGSDQQVKGQAATSQSSALPLTAQEQKTEKMTLWGITLGAPAPLWPQCPGMHTGAIGLAPGGSTCMFVSDDHYYEQVYNLIFKDGLHSVELRFGAQKDAIVRVIATDIYPSKCDATLQGLAAKFGDPVHATIPVQNGFGARWNADTYSWQTADGSQLKMNVHLTKMDSCDLEAITAEITNIRKKHAEMPPP